MCIKNKKVKILTFGSCGWDKIVDKLNNNLIYEEEGRKNSHQAVAAYRAGANSRFISFVGDDEIGKRVLKSLKQCGISTKYVKTVKGELTEVNIQYWDSETKDYELQRGPAKLSQNYTPEMVDTYKNLILKSSAVNLVSKQPKDFLTKVIELCFENNIPTYLTISHKKFDIDNEKDLQTLKKVTVIAGNYSEGEQLTGVKDIEKMLKLFPNMIITKGGEGVYYCDEDGKFCHDNAVTAGQIVETNGAGDTFIGNYMVFRAEKLPIEKSIKMAMCASALEISKMGVYSAMPYRNQTENLYNKIFEN